MSRFRSPRGYALLVVISVLAMITVSLLIIQGAILMTHRQSKLTAVREDRIEATSALIALALASDSPSSQTLTAPNGLKAQVSQMALPATHPFWQKVPVLAPREGDKLVSVEWADKGAAGSNSQFLVNRQGLRRGAINLGAPTKAK